MIPPYEEIDFRNCTDIIFVKVKQLFDCISDCIVYGSEFKIQFLVLKASQNFEYN